MFAPQCLSTLAVVKRETNSWRYPLIMAAYLFALAYARRVRHLPRGAWLSAARCWSAGMSLLLQQVLVVALVAACALYSAWRLPSVRVRLRWLELLAALPGWHGRAGSRGCVAHARAVDGRLRRLLAAAGHKPRQG